MEDTAIQQKIQEKLQSGLLPIHADLSPDTILFVHVMNGTGAPCSACDEPIMPVEARVIYHTLYKQTLQFHGICERLWKETGARDQHEHP
jgi:hypothetical protein